MFITIDCEMGGLDLSKSLLQVGLIVSYEDFIIQEKYLLNVKPDDGVYNVSASALAINKIDLVKHDVLAKTYKETKSILYNIIKDWSCSGTRKLIVVGKQVSGDVRFIWEYLISKPTWENYVSYRHLDLTSVWMFLKLTGKIPNEIGDGLTDICNYFNINTDGQHNALRDCEMTLECMRRCFQL